MAVAGAVERLRARPADGVPGRLERAAQDVLSVEHAR
jgi:hypothetical protein